MESPGPAQKTRVNQVFPKDERLQMNWSVTHPLTPTQEPQAREEMEGETDNVS